VRRKAVDSRLPVRHELPSEPGATLREAIFDHTLTFAMLFGVATGVGSCALAIASAVLLSRGKSFWLVTILCFIAAIGLGYVAIRRFRRLVEPMHVGLHGERAVAFVLRDLERQGYSVFHDVPSLKRPNEANIDHVVIGPTGIYAIETKTIRKRGSQHTIEFNEQGLSIDGHVLQSNPIPQARAVADDLVHILDRFAGQKCPVQPAVALPGWFVRADKNPWDQPIWVVNHNALVSLITSPHRPTLPNGLDIKLAGALQAHIRSAEAANS